MYLEDASSNGTWVRGAHAREWTKVHNQRRQLESGDEISLLSVVRDAGGAVENFAARGRGAKFTFVAHPRAEGAAHEPSTGGVAGADDGRRRVGRRARPRPARRTRRARPARWRAR